MRIAITSQNLKSITGHAGKCRRFWIYEIENGGIESKQLRELPIEQSFHESDKSAPHPLDDIDVLVTAGMGPGLQQRLQQKGILAWITQETDPDRAALDLVKGTLRVRNSGGEHDDHCGCHHSH